MTIQEITAMLVWTAASVVLLAIIMTVDAWFTRYKDLDEIRRGNTAVAIRFVLKLLAQTYILSRSIATSDALGEALIVSAISFVILLVLESLFRIGLRSAARIDLDQGAQEGKSSHALLAGSLHVSGALIIGALL
ncbi:DUF350 domain-containing protein [Paenibacillus methanolicus]|uniref:Uncharacterized membrane protein YjfL (UPF0719 family) n=1 Tax=Paenibacillus methanolicus TaxID=582686 RepID=A0A5S5C0D7_9BACL|nr:DUF350 domain-containing protein [Paenibacillus methanolicus]TYP72737.1 uncharacterized membrane protein YjfL (UPF0719 family) [Paenibacillus methanolicus]